MVLEPVGDQVFPDVGLDEAGLLLGGDGLDVRRQPPPDALSVERHRLGPELVAVGDDGGDVDLPGDTERPEPAVAGDVDELEVVAMVPMNTHWRGWSWLALP